MSSLYNQAKNAFLRGEIDMLNDAIYVALVDTSMYTHNPDHAFLSDVPGVLSQTEITGKVVVSGAFGGAETLVPTLAGGVCRALVIYRNTGLASTSNLIAYIDDGLGFPLYLTGADVTITWDSGINQIFRI